MRRVLGLALLLGSLVSCIDGGFPLDSGETGFEEGGCCDYECSDGTGGCVVTSDYGECQSVAEINCAGDGLDVSSVDFDESCGGACAR